MTDCVNGYIRLVFKRDFCVGVRKLGKHNEDMLSFSIIIAYTGIGLNSHSHPAMQIEPE